MLGISFVKLNPTKNMTILVKDKIAREHQRDVANALLGFDSICAEQAGFIEEPENPLAWARLQMMGGEFCGNATISLAAILARDKNLKHAEHLTIPLEVSGSIQLIDCCITAMEDHYIGKLEMPAPYEITNIDFEIDELTYRAGLVHMPGITHLIFNTSELTVNKQVIVDEIVKALDDFTSQEALGIMFYNSAEHYMEPFVFVKTTKSRCWEHCCASGSAAVAARMAHESGRDVELTITQPGGALKAFSCSDGVRVWIEGMVKIVAEGIVYI